MRLVTSPSLKSSYQSRSRMAAQSTSLTSDSCSQWFQSSTLTPGTKSKARRTIRWWSISARVQTRQSISTSLLNARTSWERSWPRSVSKSTRKWWKGLRSLMSLRLKLNSSTIHSSTSSGITPSILTLRFRSFLNLILLLILSRCVLPIRSSTSPKSSHPSSDLPSMLRKLILRWRKLILSLIPKWLSSRRRSLKPWARQLASQSTPWDSYSLLRRRLTRPELQIRRSWTTNQTRDASSSSRPSPIRSGRSCFRSRWRQPWWMTSSNSFTISSKVPSIAKVRNQILHISI